MSTFKDAITSIRPTRNERRTRRPLTRARPFRAERSTMGKPAKAEKRARETKQTLSSQLEAVWARGDLSPTHKLISASELYDMAGEGCSALPDYFAQVKRFVEGLDASPDGENELVELYQEYAAKSDAELQDEIKEL
eukprot:6513810-Prymnesium_polylepis.1